MITPEDRRQIKLSRDTEVDVTPEEPSATPRLDPSYIGLTFVGFLFALVAARLLEAFSEGNLYPTRLSHLSLASVMMITSWIGYHNSWNRPRAFIQFFNLPFWQFLLDVILVATYWYFIELTEPPFPSAKAKSTATPESILVAVSFVLYSLWDSVASAIRNSPKYPRIPSKDAPKRRMVTLGFALASVVAAVAVAAVDSHADWPVIGIDLSLALLLVLYRVVKDRFPVGPMTLDDERPARPVASRESPRDRGSPRAHAESGEAGRQSARVLEGLYSVVVAIALTRALEALLDVSANSVSIEWSLTPAFLAFIVTAIPFSHGAVRHLEQKYIEEAGLKVKSGALLIDFIILFTEGCILFVMGAAIGTIRLFSWSVIALLVTDVIWGLLARFVLSRSKHPGAEMGWVIINTVTVGLMIPFLLTAPRISNAFMVSEESFRIVVVVFFCFVRTAGDYWKSWFFYFPRP